MHFRGILIVLVILAGSRNLGFSASPLAAPAHPHLILIMADDMGFGDLSLHGNTNVKTPRIDSIGTDGARFERFFVCPVCSPTRAELLTGRYHPRCGVRDVSRGGERINLDEKTMADHFRQAGYKTGLFGKWHHGTQYPYHPLGRGFEQFYGFTEGHWPTYFDAPMDDNGQLVKGKGYLPDDITDRAIDYFAKEVGKGDAGSPVFVFLSFNTPHTPMQVPDAYWNRFANNPIALRGPQGKLEKIESTRAALAMVENMDFNVGRVLDKIEELGQAKNTMVVFLSDNGPAASRYNAEMKGRKGSVDEGGIRSPLFIRHKEKIKAGTKIPTITGAIDLLPTLAELAATSLKIDEKKPLDGLSLKPLLDGDNKNWPERLVFTHWGGEIGIRSQKYRMDARGGLFDMEADPNQKTDISGKNPELIENYRGQIGEWKKSVGLPQTKDLRPFPVGHEAVKITYLPARDGSPLGGIRRSSPAANSSYFENWKRTSDRISWDVDVIAGGEFEVLVYLANKKADLGAKIEFKLREGRLEKVLDTVYDAPVLGADKDRVPRVEESYSKEFRPVSFGKVRISAGKGTLSLQAVTVKGKAVAEVQMIALKRLEP